MLNWGIFNMNNESSNIKKIMEDLSDSGSNYTKLVRTYISMDTCYNMFKQGFNLSQIHTCMPWLSKLDIYGLSVKYNEKPVDASDEEIEEIKWTFRKYRVPKELGKIFNTPEEQAKRRFRINVPCENCGEEHIYYDIALTENELKQMDDYYDKNDRTNHYTDLAVILSQNPPVTTVREFICPICKNKYKKAIAVFRTDEIGYKIL